MALVWYTVILHKPPNPLEGTSAEFHQHIVGGTQNVATRRVDIVWDFYCEKSLKKSACDNRRVGALRSYAFN
jgi:hypothetical protein